MMMIDLSADEGNNGVVYHSLGDDGPAVSPPTSVVNAMEVETSTGKNVTKTTTTTIQQPAVVKAASSSNTTTTSWKSLTNGILYNRTAEMKQLDKVCQRFGRSIYAEKNMNAPADPSSRSTLTTKTQLILIHGPAGSGKTCLAKHLGSRLVPANGDAGFFVSVQCHRDEPHHPPCGGGDLSNKLLLPLQQQQRPQQQRHRHQHQQQQPALMVEVLKTLAHQLVVRRDDDEWVKQIGRRVQQALSEPDQRVLTDCVPQLKSILGTTTGSADAPIETARRGDGSRSSSMGDHHATNGSTGSRDRLIAEATCGGGSSSSQRRFHVVCRDFLRAMVSSDENHAAADGRDLRIVLLLDDLHWADEASLEFLEHLVVDTSLKNQNNIVYVGTYKNQTSDKGDGKTNAAEASEGDNANRATAGGGTTAKSTSLMSMIRRLKQQASEHVQVTSISLGNFTETALREMVSSLFSSSLDNQESSESLARMLMERTQGNIQFVSELLPLLWHQWTVEGEVMENNNNNNNKLAECGSLHDLLVHKLSSLPPQVLEILKVASCLGSNMVKERMLENILSEKLSVVSYCLNFAANQELLEFDSVNQGWRFSNDAVQKATYCTIPEAERELFHSTTGRRLWRKLDLPELDQHIFVVVDQLLLGKRSCWRQRQQQQQQNRNHQDYEESVAVAKLCLRAAHRAVELSSFAAAYSYLMHGISLLGPRSCWRDEYRLTLELHNAAAEVAFCTAQFEQIETLRATVNQNARNFEDTLRVETTRVNALGSSGKLCEAVERGLEILQRLKVALPPKATPKQVGTAFKSLMRKLKGKSNESILRLPMMDQPDKLAAMQMLNVISLPVILVCSDMSPLVGMKMVELSLEYGLSTVSCIGFALLGILCCGVAGDIDEGHRIGLLSIQMYKKFDATAWLPRLSTVFHGGVQSWKGPIKDTLEPLKLAHYQGLESGDIEFAMLSASLCIWNQIDITPIPILVKEMSSLCERMELYCQTTALMSMKPAWQMIENFAGRASGDATTLAGAVLSEQELEGTHRVSRAVYVFSQFHTMVLSYSFGDYAKADRCAKDCQEIMADPFGCVDLVICLFYDALTAIEMSRRSTGGRRRNFLRRANKRLVRLRAWAKHAPKNFLGKKFLVEAELAAALKKDYHTCIAKYTCAIALSREGGYIRQNALACERAGKYCWEKGEKDDAKSLLDDALKLYEKWGASSKVHHLKEETKHWNE